MPPRDKIKLPAPPRPAPTQEESLPPVAHPQRKSCSGRRSSLKAAARCMFSLMACTGRGAAWWGYISWGSSMGEKAAAELTLPVAQQSFAWSAQQWGALGRQA